MYAIRATKRKVKYVSLSRIDVLLTAISQVTTVFVKRVSSRISRILWFVVAAQLEHTLMEPSAFSLVGSTKVTTA